MVENKRISFKSGKNSGSIENKDFIFMRKIHKGKEMKSFLLSYEIGCESLV